MTVGDEEEWSQPHLAVEQLSDKSPHARLELLWHNFTIAMRHVARLQALDAQADLGVSPMHVAQKDETLASIARVCPVSHRIHINRWWWASIHPLCCTRCTDHSNARVHIELAEIANLSGYPMPSRNCWRM